MSDRWDRIGELFQRALALPPQEREAVLQTASDPDDIKNEVRSLLDAHEGVGAFLDRPPTATARDRESAPPTLDVPPLLEGGAFIGPYRIARLIGRGGMGVVYEAEDTRLHRRVALKSLSPELSREDRQRQRLKQEARAAAALSHPGIATVYALEELDDQLFIISEYLDGDTLRAEIRRGPAPLPHAIGTGLDIARALVAAHDRGIVHRDLKPENVVRTSEGAIKILDFGLAQFGEAARDLASLTKLTQSGLVAGTPSYMAPEQLLGQGVDPRTDQFAFGALLYELSTGRHPFGGQSLPSVIAQILAAAPQSPLPTDQMPLALWQVMERCLQKDPASRFPATRELVRALEAFREESPVVVQPRSDTGVPTTPIPAPHRDGSTSRALSWWRFHQFAVALAYWSMVWPAWRIHTAFGRAGLFFFFSLLAAVVTAGNLRLHLWFSSRVYPEDLPALRANVSRWIRVADIAFAVLLIGGGLALPPAQAGWAAVLISFGIGAALAFLFIEPATARAAFRPPADSDR